MKQPLAHPFEMAAIERTFECRRAAIGDDGEIEITLAGKESNDSELGGFIVGINGADLVAILADDGSEAALHAMGKKNAKGRSSSVRLRDALFGNWQQCQKFAIPVPESFNEFYAQEMERIIARVNGRTTQNQNKQNEPKDTKTEQCAEC